MPSDRPSRSTAYQYLIKEVNGFTYETFEFYCNHNSSHHFTQRELIIRDHLIIELKRLAKECLTDHQYAAIDLLYFQHMTQCEAAKELQNSNQSSLNKCIFGIPRKDKTNGLKYGGAIPKLTKYAAIDPTVMHLLFLLNNNEEEENPQWLLEELTPPAETPACRQEPIAEPPVLISKNTETTEPVTHTDESKVKFKRKNLTEEDVILIRWRYDVLGNSQKYISKMSGVAQSAISAICARKTHKNVN